MLIVHTQQNANFKNTYITLAVLTSILFCLNRIDVSTAYLLRFEVITCKDT
jgi:hypothetical protein